MSTSASQPYVHVSRILPGMRDAVLERIRKSRVDQAVLRQHRIDRFTIFATSETTDDGGGLVVAIFETSDIAALEEYLEANEEAGKDVIALLYVAHDHTSVRNNRPLFDIRVSP